MTNPFSSQGWSDKDYARAVGTLMGEAYGGKRNPASTLEDYELIADVIMNRKESDHPSYKGKSIDQLLRNAKEFSAWSKGQKNARAMATKGMAAVLGKREGKLTGITKQKHDLAVKALENVGINKSRRGNSYGSTAYNAPKGNKRSDYHEDQPPNTGRSRWDSTGPRAKNSIATRGPAPYSQYGEFGTPREAIPAATPPDVSMGRFYDAPPAAPYSPPGMNFGPDFSSPPSQALGPVTDPYGFSNVNTAVEAAPGSFAGYGPNAFGALDQAPVDYGDTYPDISAGLYGQAPAPMSNEDFNAIFGNMPDDATGSVRNAQMSFAPTVNAAQPGGPYSFSNMQSYAPAPDAATIAGDVTGYGPGGAFGSRAPSPAFDFESVFNASPMSGAAPANAPAQGAQVAQGPARTRSGRPRCRPSRRKRLTRACRISSRPG